MHELIKKAAEFAKRKHVLQTRKFSGLPYIVHPQAVAFFLQTHGYRHIDLICAAWLHDTIEDCNVTYQELVREFNVYVADLVVEVSHPNIIGDRRTRWAAYLKHYSQASFDGQRLKMADRICNLTDYWYDFDLLSQSDKEYLLKVYLVESSELAQVLRDKEADEELCSMLENIITMLQDAIEYDFQ